MIFQVGALFLLAVSAQAHVAVSHQYRKDNFHHDGHHGHHEQHVHHGHHEVAHNDHHGHHEVAHNDHHGHHEVEHHDHHHSHPSYKFEYSVKDPHTHDDKSQYEERHGDHVVGHYALVEPTGNKRTVHYEADSKHGFRANVQRAEVHHDAPHHHLHNHHHDHHSHHAHHSHHGHH